MPFMVLSKENYEIMMFKMILSNLLEPDISEWNLFIENAVDLTIIENSLLCVPLLGTWDVEMLNSSVNVFFFDLRILGSNAVDVYKDISITI